jgi:hypothetical protein
MYARRGKMVVSTVTAPKLGDGVAAVGVIPPSGMHQQEITSPSYGELRTMKPGLPRPHQETSDDEQASRRDSRSRPGHVFGIRILGCEDRRHDHDEDGA